jgi:hypothetical protein
VKSRPQPERATQNRVIVLFRDELGYRHVEDWSDRDGNSKVEKSLLSAWLTKTGYTPAQISAALCPSGRFCRQQLNRVPVQRMDWKY